MRFGAVLFYGTLVLLVLGGACSAALIATDWNSVASKESFEGLGVLLFLVGAGIGALFVLATVFLLRIFQKRKNAKADAICAAAAEAVSEAARVQSKLPKDDSEKLSNDAHVKEVYEVEVRHAQIPGHHQGTTIQDSGLLNKFGNGFKSKEAAQVDGDGVLHQISVRMPRWDSVTSDVFSPTRKSWEKSAQNMDMMTAPTPRIFVLPPDGQASHGKHSRSRSELPLDGRMELPDVTILDIPGVSKHAGSEEDVESGALSQSGSEESSNTFLRNSDSDKEDSAVMNKPNITIPEIRSVDTNLGMFLKSFNQSKNKMTYMLSVMVEEVLPRPDSGLLKRMLRMSEIPVGMVEGSGEPILHLRVGSECHLSIGLIKLNQDPAPFEISGPHKIRIKALDGAEVNLNASCEAVDEVEYVTSAIWDLKSHASHSLTRESTGDSSSTVLTPIEMTLGFRLCCCSTTESNSNFIQEVEVKKTFMASMRRELVSLKVDERFKYEDDVLDFVLSKMELISMPSLLTFLEIDSDPRFPHYLNGFH